METPVLYEKLYKTPDLLHMYPDNPDNGCLFCQFSIYEANLTVHSVLFLYNILAGNMTYPTYEKQRVSILNVLKDRPPKWLSWITNN